MKVWLTLLMLTVTQFAHAEPAAFGIRINTTTLNEIKQTHQVTPITTRAGSFDPAAEFCVPLEGDDGVTYCDSTPHPSSIDHAYTVDIRDSGAQYFEVRTDSKGIVKFILVDFDDTNPKRNPRLTEVGDRLRSKYRGAYDYDLFQDGYFRPVYKTTNAFITQWYQKGDDHFFVILSDKDYLKTTLYDLTAHYEPQEKSAADQF